MEVPLLDFSSFTNGSSNQQKRFCRDLADSFQKYGFVKLANHGISEAVMKAVFDYVSYRGGLASLGADACSCIARATASSISR